MKQENESLPKKNYETPAAVDAVEASGWDWPSILMIAAALCVTAYCFWPARVISERPDEPVAVGHTAPGLWCVDVQTKEPALGLVPRGWFTWIVLAPGHHKESSRLLDEMPVVEKQWQSMADIDRWRRVVIVSNPEQASDFLLRTPEPANVPFDVVLGTSRTWSTWGSAERVRHILIEPTGRILMIEPAELDHSGTLKRIADDLRRRLQTWEGEFDDLPRFS